MIRFRVAAVATIVSAAGGSLAAVDLGGRPWWVLRTLLDWQEDGYAAWYAWVLAAPLVLAAAALVVRRSPWPWTLAVTLHLASTVAAMVRVEHWLPGWSWAALGTVVCLGLWSVAEALGRVGRFR